MKGPKSYLLYLILGCLLVFNNLPATAQTGNGLFDHSTLFIYNQDKGLPQNTIQNMCFDKWGFLWLATTDGLARFDGRTMKTYPKITKSSNFKSFVRLNEDTILALPSTTEAVVIARGNVSCSIPYDEERYGMCLNNSYLPIPASLVKNWTPEIRNLVNDTLKISNGRGVLYSQDTVAIMSNNRHIVFFDKTGMFNFNIPEKKISNDNFILLKKIFVYVDNTNKNVILYSIKNKPVKVPLPFINTSPWTIHQSESSDRFFMENSGKLYQVQQDTLSGKLIYSKLIDNFNYSNVTTIVNTNNMLLVGTLTNGLYVYKKNMIVTYTNPNQIKNTADFYFAGINNYYAQLPLYNNQTVLTGSNNLFNNNGFIKAVPLLKDVSIRAMYRDKHDNYWFYRDKFVWKTTHPETGPFVSMHNFPTEIAQYFEDHKGNIWIGAPKNWGYFESGTDKFRDFSAFIIPDGFNISNTFSCMAETPDAHILVSGYDGIFNFNPARPEKGFSPYSLQGLEVRHFELQQETGNIWAGTKGKGMCSIKDNGKTVTYFLQDKNGDMRTVHYFLTDKNGLLWISTNNGLFVTTKKALQDFEENKGTPFYFKVSKSDGLLSNEFNGNCQYPMLLFPDGSLTISSIAGLAWTNVNNFKNPFPKDSIFLERTDSGFTTSFANGSTVYLDHNQNRNVSFSLGFADWNNAFNIETGYIFGNTIDSSSSSKWQALAADNTITFPVLTTGDYFITVRKRTGFGSNDYLYTSINIKVMPLWYETKWFYALLLLPLLLLVQLAGYIRNRRLQKANQLLNTRVTEATVQLQDANLELTQLNDTKDKLITMFNHDLSVPMFYVTQMLTQMTTDKKIKAQLPETAEGIALMSTTMSDLNVLMDDILYWVKMQQYNFELAIDNNPVDTKKIIYKTLNLFQFRIDANNINLTTEIENEVTIFTDERLFSSILYNVISNAIKFTKNGYLNIRLITPSTDTDQFLLIFENGTSQQQRTENLNTAITSSEQEETEKEQSRGIGLMLVKDFAAMLGFTITYNFSKNGIFTLLIKGPLDRS
jgi:signal transduction histidine kinase